MKLEKISYAKIFPTGVYLNERIGFEASISEREDAQLALMELRNMAEKFHKEANPHLYNQTSELHIKEPEKVIKREYERMEILIDDCKTIEELAKYKPDLPADLMPAYMNKLKALQNGLHKNKV